MRDTYSVIQEQMQGLEQIWGRCRVIKCIPACHTNRIPAIRHQYQVPFVEKVAGWVVWSQ